MNDLSVLARASLWWLLPLALLAALIGWEIGWGSAVRMRAPSAEPVAPKPVTMGLLPDYVIAGGIAEHTETVNRTLFNPTRRPAPVAVAEAAKPRIQRGQYTLTGTTVAGDRSLAFLKETNGGKPRTVKQGETINGMLVAEVRSDRVKLTLGDESEEIVLKVSTNPRPTPQPVVAQAPPAALGAAAISPGAQPPVAAGQDAAQTLAERRRAARAAQAAQATQAGGTGDGAPVASSGAGAPVAVQPNTAQPAAQAGAAGPAADPGWAQVYQRYQQRRAQ
jgi:hypothetical protein